MSPAVEPISHFVFVDFENVPDVDLGPVEGKPVHVTLLIGKNQKKLDFALVQQIHRLPRSQIELVEVGASGRNALDLTLAYYLGRAVVNRPSAQFCIVSKDKDFEPMISHLIGTGVKVVRCGEFHLLPFLPRPKAIATARGATPAKATPRSKKSPEDRCAKVIARLKNPHNQSRPSTQSALFAHIKTALGKEYSDDKRDSILRELTEKHVLAVEAGDKVVYATTQ